MGHEVTIREVLVPTLKAAFSDFGVRFAEPPAPVAVFPAACSEVGDVQIYDDGDEATVVIENVTHHHTNPYDPEMNSSDRARWITNEVVEFLQTLFDDRVFLWSRRQGHGGGGCHWPFEGVIPDGVPDDADLFIWSKRIERPA